MSADTQGDRMSLIEHEMICWDCHGSGVVASEDAKPIPCPLCQDEYGRLKVVPATTLRGAVVVTDAGIVRAERWMLNEMHDGLTNRECIDAILNALRWQ